MRESQTEKLYYGLVQEEDDTVNRVDCANDESEWEREGERKRGILGVFVIWIERMFE